MKLQDKIALVTGAGSGIGRAIAWSLARRGCSLALVDKNEHTLLETALQVRALGIRASTHVLDLSDRDAVGALPRQVFEHHGSIDLLVNNAGIAAGGPFLRISEAHFDKVMAVNFGAAVQLTRLLLPHLQTRPVARIVNISSLYGLVSLPEQSAYAASKFALRGFSNSLRCELAGTPVGVTVVHPGGIATNIARDALPAIGLTPAEIAKGEAMQRRFLRMQPSKAGEIIVKGLEKNRSRILVGRDAKAVALFERLFPVSYWNFFRLWAK